MSYRFEVMMIVSLFAKTTQENALILSSTPGYRPFIVAVESRRGFGGDGSGGTDSGSLFGCSSILSISRLASSHASRFYKADGR
jgi:hypothetical protein